MWFFGSRKSSLSSSNSLRNRVSGSSSYSLPLSRSDQFPFPTDPELVRKARHYDYPKYLPKPEASVSEVRYFLYTLLTSKRNECAKQYPEWVLETCMAWSGDGDDLRRCSEEQLAAICPFSAQAGQIDSRKHKPGTYVPVPARNMIGRVIMSCVAELKAREKQSDGLYNFHQQQERPQSPAGTGFYTHARSTPNLCQTDVDFSDSRSGVDSPYLPMPPASAYDPDAWMPSKTTRHRPPPLQRAQTPAFFTVPYRSANTLDSLGMNLSALSRWSSVTSNTQDHSIFSSTSDSTAKTSAPGSLNDSKAGFFSYSPDQERSPTPFMAGGLPASPYSVGQIGNAMLPTSQTRPELNAVQRKRPQRYAPRRPSTLRVSSTGPDGRPISPYPTAKEFNAPENDSAHDITRCETPVPNDACSVRQSVGALPNISIPEEITEESNEECDNLGQTMHDDSASSRMATAKQISGHSSSANYSPLSQQSPDSTFIRPTSPASVVSTTQSITNPYFHPTWYAPRPSSIMPILDHNRSFRQASAGFGRSATSAPGLRPSLPYRAGTSVDHRALATVPPEQLINDHNATLEAEYRTLHRISNIQNGVTPRQFSGVREERSMEPNPMHQFGQDNASKRHRPRTMIEVIEEREQLCKMPLWGDNFAMRRPRNSLR